MFLLRSVTLCCLIYMHLFSLDWMGWDANTSLSQFEAPSRYGFRVPGSCFSLLVVTFKKESISEYPLSSFAIFYTSSITIISLSCGISRDINKSSMTETPTTTYRHPFLILTQSFHIVPSSKRFHNTPH